MSKRILYFDCFSGASGDMILGALVDLGLPLEALSDDLARLPCGPVRLRAEAVTRCAVRATRIHVETPDETQPHRGLSEIRKIIGAARLSKRVKERSIRVFTRLAEAEAKIHAVSVEQIHFHELGALDAIADIVGAACAIERLGVEHVLFSKLRLGHGTVHCRHGALPVPAPATAQLVVGFESEMGPVEAELLTPTAAAILTTLGEQQDPAGIQIEKIGYGAGARELAGRPNLLRAFLGVAALESERDFVWVVEANLDDVTPEVCGHTMDRLLAAGALDAYAVPIQMKKSRPALMLCAIADAESLARVEQVFFRETTTLGLRRRRAERSKLTREIVSVETPYGTVRVKVGTRGGETITISPEYEDCRQIALTHDLPLRHVIALAREAFVERDTN